MERVLLPKSATKFTYEVVIAAFEANLDWAKNLSPPVLTLYLKGHASPLPEHATIVHLNNIGREAETLVYHVVHNYDRLAEYLIFLQDNPFRHMDVASTINLTERGLQAELDDLISNQSQHARTSPFCRE